ncbi:uncharacterized protein LOC129630692 [Bubalus kerabau]|uniref:uncharacterized protein LOC129630692 n=1 Tax=Bubalus carabanensis TaxID=3119969 RepID=UPI00244EAB60|nr:uncharacterized protein LOC129630692 [Bubalus carabanensis]
MSLLPGGRWRRQGPSSFGRAKVKDPQRRGLRTLVVRIPLKLSGLWRSSSRMEVNEMNKPMWEKVPSPAFKQELQPSSADFCWIKNVKEPSTQSVFEVLFSALSPCSHRLFRAGLRSPDRNLGAPASRDPVPLPAASGGQRAPGTHRLPGPSRGFGLGRRRGGPAKKAPPTQAQQGPIGARCDKLWTRPQGAHPPIKRSGWREGPIRSCRSVPAVGKEQLWSVELGGTAAGKTRSLTGRGSDQWRERESHEGEDLSVAPSWILRVWHTGGTPKLQINFSRPALCSECVEGFLVSLHPMPHRSLLALLLML